MVTVPEPSSSAPVIVGINVDFFLKRLQNCLPGAARKGDEFVLVMRELSET
jgi:hypothetical protein